jgi:hypothetical protein
MHAFFQRIRSFVIKATGPIRRKGWRHWARFAALLLLGSWIGHILSENDRFTDWRYWLYQKQVRWERRGPVYPRYTALVLLNDDDYWSLEFQARSKYKRDKLAALLDRLNAAGVNTVAFDIYMDAPYPDQPNYEFPDYRAEDQIFLDAVGRMCSAGRHVVLATEYWYADPKHPGEGWSEVPPFYLSHLSSLPCITRGHVNFSVDMRKLPGVVPMKDGKDLDSLSLAVTHITDPIAYADIVHHDDRGFRFAQFLTPEDFATRDGRQFIFSGVDVERMSLNELREALADRTVIIGGHYQPTARGVGDYIDMFNSPGGLESGAMLHANYVEAMRDPVSNFAPVSDRTAEIIEWCLACILALIGALEVHAGWKWAGFLISLVASVILTFVLLQNLGIFLDFFIPILMILAHTVVESLLEMRHELHHARLQLHSLADVTRQSAPKEHR